MVKYAKKIIKQAFVVHQQQISWLRGLPLNSLTISINNTPNIFTGIRRNLSGIIYQSKPLFTVWDCIQIVHLVKAACINTLVIQ